jgi:hypothetical protein
MTAALVLEPRQESRPRRIVAVRPEPDMIRKARLGDQAALAELFDLIATDLYGEAFTATRSVQRAERVTDQTIARLPKILRSRRWTSVEALRAEMVGVTRGALAAGDRRRALAARTSDLRAWTRHLMLASTASFAAVYGVLQAFS